MSIFFGWQTEIKKGRNLPILNFVIVVNTLTTKTAIPK